MNRIRLVVTVAVVVAIASLGMRLQHDGAAPASAIGSAGGRSAVVRPSEPATPRPDDPAGSPNRSAYVPADADGYAQAVAAMVFGQDSRVLAPEVYRDTLLALADPQLTRAQRAELQADVAGRIPPGQTWDEMRAVQQWSTWTGRLVWEPATRVESVAGAAGPGWVLRNVSGVQATHTGGPGQEHEATRPRTLTIGMRCPAPGTGIDRCRLAMIAATVVP